MDIEAKRRRSIQHKKFQLRDWHIEVSKIMGCWSQLTHRLHYFLFLSASSRELFLFLSGPSTVWWSIPATALFTWLTCRSYQLAGDDEKSFSCAKCESRFTHLGNADVLRHNRKLQAIGLKKSFQFVVLVQIFSILVFFTLGGKLAGVGEISQMKNSLLANVKYRNQIDIFEWMCGTVEHTVIELPCFVHWLWHTPKVWQTC